MCKRFGKDASIDLSTSAVRSWPPHPPTVPLLTVQVCSLQPGLMLDWLLCNPCQQLADCACTAPPTCLRTLPSARCKHIMPTRIQPHINTGWFRHRRAEPFLTAFIIPAQICRGMLYKIAARCQLLPDAIMKAHPSIYAITALS